MLTSELDYELPEALIAQKPAEPRDSSRLMVVDVREESITHHIFRDLPSFLLPGDALILNETKVLPARLVAHKAGSVAWFRRSLGNQILGKLVIEPGDEHLNDGRPG